VEFAILEIVRASIQIRYDLTLKKRDRRNGEAIRVLEKSAAQ